MFLYVLSDNFNVVKPKKDKPVDFVIRLDLKYVFKKTHVFR